MVEREQKAESHDTMTFMEHLEELRQRLIKCLVAVIVGVLVCWFFREELRQFLEAPLYAAWKTVPGLPAPSPLNFTSLMEPFVAYLKIAGIGGVFFASPIIFFQLWRFVSPGLYRNEKRMALPFVLISSALFVIGSSGAYAYVFPIGFSFFLQFSSGGTVDSLESEKVMALAAGPSAQAVPEADETPLNVAGQPSESRPTPVARRNSESLNPKDNTEMENAAAATETVALEPDTTNGENSPPDSATDDTAIDTATSDSTAMDSGDDDSVLENKGTQDLASNSAKQDADGVPKDVPESKTKVQKKNSSVGTARAGSAEHGKWERVRRLYAWAQQKLLGGDCGEFQVTPLNEGIQLKYIFSIERCGKKPFSLHLERNDRPLDLTMSLIGETDTEATYQTLDSSHFTTPVFYRLQVVREAAQKLLPVLMVKDYLDFAVKLMLAFGLVFELPILIFFLAYAGIVDYMQLIRFGRWFVVLSLTVAAILTPPDVITQILLATPLVILYYLSIGVVFFMGRRRKRDE
ncbi:MAG: twin-arginine translocase subunit TatC [Deltaproteobacteria bacterium]|nr:twin-arginine translocase subunit TatC [Deltaproteobacteria bacterium]